MNQKAKKFAKFQFRFSTIENDEALPLPFLPTGRNIHLSHDALLSELVGE